jgi:predicted phosphoribosyltransferase
MSEFANLADGGRRLGPMLAGAMSGVVDPVILAVIPNGVPVAAGIRESFDVPVRALPVRRSEDGVVIDAVPDLVGRNVIVVDDGVETGTVARAAVAALLESGVESVTLAVPVCAMEAMASLQHRYERIVAVSRPLVHRSLARHYTDFDTIDEAEAHRQLGMMPSG